MEQIKRANRLYTSDTIFLKPTLLIPAPAQPGGPSPEDGDKDEDEDKDTPVPSGDTPAVPTPSRHDLSATDFLRQLDAEIGRGERAPPAPNFGAKWGLLAVGGWRARRATPQCHPLRPRSTDEAEGSRSPPCTGVTPRGGPRLGPRPLTRTPRAAALRDAEDEIFTL
nr:lysM and putative peptidoglycan-binding domain-containing protein 1 [Columba livia]